MAWMTKFKIPDATVTERGDHEKMSKQFCTRTADVSPPHGPDERAMIEIGR